MSSPSIFHVAFGSIFLGVCVFLLLLPMLATAPLSGDGAELVAVAVQGGVPHAPGFPLQAWLDRLVVDLPVPLSPATKISLLCAAAHAGATAVLADAARLLGASLSARALAGLAYAFFPSTWALGVQPEVFAPAHLLLAALLFGAVRATVVAPGFAAATLWGAAFGAALAQHPILVVAAPAVVVGARACARSRGPRAVVAAGVAAFAVYVGLYATVPALRTISPWPDWGAVDDVDDLVALALRRDYGSLRLASPTAGETISGVAVLARALVGASLPVVVLAALGAYAARARRGVLVAAGGTLVAALAFLAYARFGSGVVVATAYLERFQGLFVVPCALLAGLGLDVVARAVGARGPAFASVLASVVVVGAFLGGYEGADAAPRRELAVLRLALGASLPADTVWLAGTDAEVFGGALSRADVESLDTAQRWPVAAHLLGLPWYRAEVLPRVEPGVPWDRAPRPVVDAASVAAFALSQGRAVASTERSLAEAAGAPARLDGLLWIADGRDGDELTWRTVEGAALLCALVDELAPMSDEAPAFGRGTWALFARAFDGASQYLERVDPRAGVDAAAIARSLDARVVDDEVLARCAALRARVDASRSDLRRSIVDDPNREVP